MTDGEPETVVSASLQKIKLIQNPIKPFYLFIFYFIKSETSDSFVCHFNGHFAYLNALDIYFKPTFSGFLSTDYDHSLKKGSTVPTFRLHPSFLQSPF